MDNNDGTTNAQSETKEQPVKRGRGRPKGSKNKPKQFQVDSIPAPVADATVE